MELFSNPLFNKFQLPVSRIHTLNVHEYGNKDGHPIVFLHGGPGGGISEFYAKLFDPAQYRLILFDQRGCGESTPHAELNENTTWDLVEDIEKIRKHLQIEKWSVFGGSWGSTLALCYAIKHACSIEALFLRGIFLLRDFELKWFYQDGASYIFPDAWDLYLKPIPIEERHDLIKAYHRKLTSNDKSTRIKAAKAWSIWEASTSKLIQDEKSIHSAGEDIFAEAFARIECHYFVNGGFLPTNNFILEQIDHYKHLPCTIVHGRYDVVCPIRSGYDLHKLYPNSKFHIIPNAGHSLTEVPIYTRLINELDRYYEKK